jgi:fumarate reductase subunit C
MNSPGPDKSKLYYPTMPATWWLTKRSYFLFMIRELTSVFIAIFLIVFLVQIYQLAEGQQAYTAFIQRLGSPGWITFHVVALLFAVYHTFTWFQSSSVVIPIKIGRQEIPRSVVLGLHFGAWIVASAVILVLFILLQS